MVDAYSEINNFWEKYFAEGPRNLDSGVLMFLGRHGIRIRQHDGELKQITISKPTSVSSAYVVGLRYNKMDGTKTEDHVLVQNDGTVTPHYRRRLEQLLHEYKGTHKQQVDYSEIASAEIPTILEYTV